MGKLKNFLFGTTLLGGLIFGGAHMTVKGGNSKGPKSTKPKTENVYDVDDEPDMPLLIPTQSNANAFTKKYKITDRASFDALYKAAKPFVFASLIPTENWRPDFHNDRQKNTGANSAGVGLFYVGVDKNGNLDFSSTHWIMTRQFFNNYKKKHKSAPKNMTPGQIYDGTCGWFENMEKGRHLTELFNHLKGAELTINEFTAIVSVYYNDNVIGKEVCRYVVKNYKNPRDCAKYILGRKAEMPGIKSRRVHEALVYLNYDNYCLDVYGLKVDGKTNTSVSGVSGYRTKLLSKNGFTNNNLMAAKNTICNKTVKNGKSVKSWVSSISSSKRDAILAFYKPTKASLEMDKRGELYDKALQKYNSKDYRGALALFQEVVKQHGNSADLHNDMAICYYHLKQYGKCIEQCQLVLATGERDKYMFADYNAGLAYEAQQNYTKAIANYKAAIQFANEFGDKSNAAIYSKALQRVEKAQTKAKPNKPNNAKKKQAYNQGRATIENLRASEIVNQGAKLKQERGYNA